MKEWQGGDLDTGGEEVIAAWFKGDWTVPAKTNRSLKCFSFHNFSDRSSK